MHSLMKIIPLMRYRGYRMVQWFRCTPHKKLQKKVWNLLLVWCLVWFIFVDSLIHFPTLFHWKIKIMIKNLIHRNVHMIEGHWLMLLNIAMFKMFVTIIFLAKKEFLIWGFFYLFNSSYFAFLLKNQIWRSQNSCT